MRLETTLNWLSVLTPPFHHSLLLLTLLRLCAELWKSVEVKSCHHMLCGGVLRLSVYVAYIATLWPILRQNMCTRYQPHGTLGDELTMMCWKATAREYRNSTSSKALVCLLLLFFLLFCVCVVLHSQKLFTSEALINFSSAFLPVSPL